MMVVVFLNSILTAGPASTPFVYMQKVKLQLQFYCWQPCIVDQSTSVTSLAKKRSRLFELPRRGYEYLFRFMMINMIKSLLSKIHSICGLSYDRSTASSKESLPQSVIYTAFSFRTLQKVDQKYLESFEMWCWRRMEIIS